MLKPFTILPNTCAECGAGPLETVYAANKDQANSGTGLCAKCAGVETPAAAPTSTKSITNMTKAELVTVAQAMGIVTDEGMTKAQLLDLIAAGN